MSRLPVGWAGTSLGALGNYWNGRAFKKSEWRPVGHGRPIIRIQDLTGSHQKPNYFEGAADDRCVARAGDILVSWAATLGVFEWQGPEAVVNQHIFKVDSLINPRFHRYLLESVLDDLRTRSHGTGMMHVTRSVFDETSVSLPPLAEQVRIVGAIEEQFSRLDEAERLLLSARHRSVRLRMAMEYVLDGALVPLGELLLEPLANGRSVPTASNGAGFPVLRLTALRGGRVDLNERKVGAWQRSDAKRFLVCTGDFLVSRGNGSLFLVGRGGIVGTVQEEVAYPDTMIRVRVNRRRITPEYLRLVWDSEPVRRQIEGLAKTTAGIYKVNQQDLAKVVVPTPEPDAQVRIVADLGWQQSALDSLTTTIKHALIRAGHLHRSVLAKALSGALVAQDPTDEPASELLARIVADRPTDMLQRRRHV